MAGLQPQIVILEKRISQELSTSSIENKKYKEQYQGLQKHLTATDNCVSEIKSDLDKSNLERKSLKADVDEYQRKLSSKIAGLDMRLQDELSANKTDVAKKMMTIQNRMTADTGRLQKEIDSRGEETTQKVRECSEDIVERLDRMKTFLLDDSEKKRGVMMATVLEDFKSFRLDVKNQFSCIDLTVDQLHQSQSKLALIGPGKSLLENNIMKITNDCQYHYHLEHVIVILKL
jgi:chromosome segregation ATPase